MKVTKAQLKQIIKEEIEATLDEKFRMAPEQIQKCQKLSDIIARGAIAQDYGGDPRHMSPGNLGAQAAFTGPAEQAKEEYKKFDCDGVLRNVNEDLY